MGRNKIVVAKKRATTKQVLKYVFDNLQILFPQTKKNLMKLKYSNIPDWEDYLPASVYLAADTLKRRGFIEKISTPDGILVKITDQGKKQILKYDLLKLTPPKTKWDGQWRLVFFDIAEIDRKKRDQLRIYLRNLGMEQMQESVFVSPYDVFDQVCYLREVLDVPHGVKLAKLSWIENQDELKQIFDIG
ncbi:MAG: CRISPR-associated endonuclease Cas2 [Patescibacteria group bacterium]